MALIKKTESDEDVNRIISDFNSLSKDDKVQLVSYFIDELKRLHNISEQDILGKREICIPVGAFENERLSSLEAVVKYLKEELKLKFSKIGKMLNRSNKTIWATYHNAVKKMPSSFGLLSRGIMIPVSAFSNRSFSTLESVVMFLKDIGYSNHEIALMLRLDDSTIWTVYDRVKKKRGMKL